MYQAYLPAAKNKGTPDRRLHHSYYLEKGKAAVLYTATARFICPDFQCRPRDDREVIELSVCEQLHLDIFQSLIVIYNRAIMTPSKSNLSKQEKKRMGEHCLPHDSHQWLKKWLTLVCTEKNPEHLYFLYFTVYFTVYVD